MQEAVGLRSWRADVNSRGKMNWSPREAEISGEVARRSNSCIRYECQQSNKAVDTFA